jgi:hypothetical protein
MAVKEKTSKKAPTKFEDKDLQTLRDLQGQTERLNMSENQLKEELKKIDQKEAELGKEFATKYGVGNVDIETGNFTPAS